jgi:predicted enzyme related to lactoylglutathione lyase
MASNPKGTSVEIKNPTVVHFEIPADDIDRARKFYTALFGWKIEKSVVKKDGSSMDY